VGRATHPQPLAIILLTHIKSNKNMRLKYLIIPIFFCWINGFSQTTVKDLEVIIKKEIVNDFNAGRNTAKKILTIDNYNENAVRYLVDSYWLTGNKDSIKLLFENLIKVDPKSPYPLLLRAKYDYSFESRYNPDKLNLLNEAYCLDSSNHEVNYQLGICYYMLFSNLFQKPNDIHILENYARKAKLHFDNLVKTKSSKVGTIKYHLVQVSNFLNVKSNIKEFETYIHDPDDSYYPVNQFLEFPIDWHSNFNFNVNEAFENSYSTVKGYTNILIALHEPKLYNQPTNKQIFRFTWVRSFDNPISIRIENDNDKYVLYWKTSNGINSNKPGEIVIDKSKELRKVDWQQFNDLLNKIDFWNLNTLEFERKLYDDYWEYILNQGTDGAQWILEGVEKNKFHVVERWSPENTEYEKCCLYLLSLTDLQISKDKIY
jgi:hypothetical protein